jgi:predicted nucleotidyltransferase
MSLARLQSVDVSDSIWPKRLKGIVRRLTAVNKGIKVFIFGSFVEGRFTAESDLDIAVILADNSSEKKFIDEVYARGSFYDWPLDLIVLKKSKFDSKKKVGGVCFDIFESGVELYPRWKLK